VGNKVIIGINVYIYFVIKNVGKLDLDRDQHIIHKVNKTLIVNLMTKTHRITNYNFQKLRNILASKNKVQENTKFFNLHKL
jgi:hypothetical protein